MKPEALPTICLSAVCAALMTAAVAFADDSPPALTMLVFHAPVETVIVASYDTLNDCEEVAFTLQRYTTVATYSCEAPE